MNRMSIRMAALLFFVLGVGAAVPGAAAPPAPAVVNGEFELAVPAKDQACAVFGDTSIRVLPEPGPWLTSVAPCESGAVKALHWSSSRVTQFGDHDGSGDREARIDGSVTLPAGDPIGSHHNFWQAYPSPHQAFSANFTALAFRVEQGTTPDGAFVQLSLSETPLREAHPFILVYIDCSLTFRIPAGSFGDVSLDPATGSFAPSWEGCDDTAAAWTAADTAGRRALLAQLRIVQNSFWGFQTGAPLTIDGVAIEGARTAVEEAAGI